MTEEIPLRQRRHEHEGDAVGVLHERPVPKSTCAQFRAFLWNKQERKLLGRTATSWLKILVFYVVFYAAICGLTAACWFVFYRMIDHHVPYRHLSESRIGSSPGLGYRPRSLNADSGESTLELHAEVTEKGRRYNTSELLAIQLQEFLHPYITPPGENRELCNYSHEPEDRTNKSCWQDAHAWTPCTAEKRYGYFNSAPCVFLKLNKIYGWKPEFYDDIENLPNEMPNDLEIHIRNISRHDSRKLKTVWVSCEGESAEDKAMLGPVRVVSEERGFPGYFYPYINTKDYLSPLVALYFERPAVGKLVGVVCRTWAKNINYERKDSIGLIRFQIYIHKGSRA